MFWRFWRSSALYYTVSVEIGSGQLTRRGGSALHLLMRPIRSTSDCCSQDTCCHLAPQDASPAEARGFIGCCISLPRYKYAQPHAPKEGVVVSDERGSPLRQGRCLHDEISKQGAEQTGIVLDCQARRTAAMQWSGNGVSELLKRQPGI